MPARCPVSGVHGRGGSRGRPKLEITGRRHDQSRSAVHLGVGCGHGRGTGRPASLFAPSPRSPSAAWSSRRHGSPPRRPHPWGRHDHEKAAWRAVPTRAASPSRTDPGLLCVPPARLDLPLWGRGWVGGTTEPRGHRGGRPRPAGTPILDRAVAAGCYSTGGGPVAARAGWTSDARVGINSRSGWWVACARPRLARVGNGVATALCPPVWRRGAFCWRWVPGAGRE